MKVQIVGTTDGKFLGHTFDSMDNPIILSFDTQMIVENITQLADGIRFISSNYIIDTIRI